MVWGRAGAFTVREIISRERTIWAFTEDTEVFYSFRLHYRHNLRITKRLFC